ncbi:MAG TPA: energy transducer TonB [Desulfuromonadales bacterium]|nr:energy transducer TonB [Desulfuromonadales bacterium]
MSDQYIEKSFLLMVIVSLLLHVGGFAALYYLPQPKKAPTDPVFIDLQQIPELQQKSQLQTERHSERRVRVPRETAPPGNAERDGGQKVAPAETGQPREASPGNSSTQRSIRQPLPQVAPGSSADSLLKPRPLSSAQSQPQVFPSAGRMAQLEESYRKKFEKDIAEGDTRFLNSDDIQFGSFLRRFEGAVYGVWRYPQEAAMRGIEGITPVRITFNRRGEITGIRQLESSGARILDEEVLRTLRAIGPVGGFPKGYDKEEFHLIAFFQYGGTRRALR